MNPYYPVYLDLRGRPVAVVGGGEVAAEKVEGLLAAGARVKVIAPELSGDLLRLRDTGVLAWVPRAYRRGDLAGMFLVLAERSDQATHARIFAEAEERGIFANVQDEVPYCSFIAPSIVRQGDLTVAISTRGHAPVLAVRLRQDLEKRLGPEYARFLTLAGSVRRPLAERFPSFTERKDRWYRLVDSDVLELLRQGDESRARRRFADILGVEPEVAA